MSSPYVAAAQPPEGTRVGHWMLRPEASSARLARRYISQSLDGAEEQILRRASLIVSELVTNAVNYGRGGIGLSLEKVSSGWVISVTDSSSAPPMGAQATQRCEGGRGLVIVQRVSQSVGWARTPMGKVVWAQFT
ncbi:MAG: ATP-binding protein [Angustibacter sp.]